MSNATKKKCPVAPFLRFEYNKDTDCWYGLYAWTPDREYAIKFMETRNPKIFTMRKVEIDPDSIEEEKLHTLQYLNLRIVKYDFSEEYPGVVLPLISAEADILSNKDSLTSNFLECGGYTKRFAESCFRFDLLNKRLRKSLDKLGFSKFLVEYQFAGAAADLSDPSMIACAEELTDRYISNIRYGAGLSGEPLPEWDIDKLVAFVYVFGDFLREG